MNTFIRFIISILLPLSAGFIGSIFTISAIPTWYSQLNKPSWNPPNFIFGPVWTTLFILMGIALFLVWSKGFQKENVRTAIIVFLVHLIFNCGWSIIFFGLKNPAWAFMEILALWLMAVASAQLFYRITPVAGLLLVPYIVWTTFAAYLNFTIWMLNP